MRSNIRNNDLFDFLKEKFRIIRKDKSQYLQGTEFVKVGKS